MNAGLGNLDVLKKHLLAGSLRGQTTFDQVITDIGQGVAALFEQYCNRNFARVVGDQAIFRADRVSFVLPRYPVESVSAVDLKQKDSDGWVSQDLSFIESTSLAAGIVYLPEQADAGPFWFEVRFTYTGGFWFETKEPDDADYPSTMPAGARALPADLKMAWLMQCREIWNKIDKTGEGIINRPDVATLTGKLDLPVLITKTLWNYKLIDPL